MRRRQETGISHASGPLRRKNLNIELEPEPETEAIATFKSLSVNTSKSQTVDHTNLVMTSEAKLTIDPSTSQSSDEKKNNDTKKLNTANEKRSREIRPPHELRYDQRSHFPKFDSKENPTRCKKENCGLRTHMYCVKCNVHLCISRDRDCFKDFHVLVLPQN